MTELNNGSVDGCVSRICRRPYPLGRQVCQHTDLARYCTLLRSQERDLDQSYEESFPIGERRSYGTGKIDRLNEEKEDSHNIYLDSFRCLGQGYNATGVVKPSLTNSQT